MSVVADGQGSARSGSLPPPPPPGAAAAGAAAAAPAPALPPAHRRRQALTGSRTPGDVPTRRRWGRVAAGMCLALLGGLLFAVLYLSAGQRVEVLVAAGDISPYETIERDDLRIERVAADPDVATIDGDDLDAIVGRVAAASLPEGALIAPNQVYAADAQVVASSEAVVGILLAPGQAPSGLSTGDELLIGIEPASGDEGGPRQVEGWLLELGDRDDQTGERDASVVVPRTSALEVGTAAADDRATLMVTGGGGG